MKVFHTFSRWTDGPAAVFHAGKRDLLSSG